MLSRAHRFHGLQALDFAYKRGQTVRGQAISLRYCHNNRQQDYRVAVVVSKKVSKSAVMRNRIRRRVYEVVRTQAATIKEPYDLVFSVYVADVATMDALELQKQVSSLLYKARVTAN